jgi:hypothetical protein
MPGPRRTPRLTRRADPLYCAAVREVLAEYPFAVRGAAAVAVMGGEDEGAFQWLTLNYLLGNLGGGIQARTRSAGPYGACFSADVTLPAVLALVSARAEDGGGDRPGRRQRATGARAEPRGGSCRAGRVRLRDGSRIVLLRVVDRPRLGSYVRQLRGGGSTYDVYVHRRATRF